MAVGMDIDTDEELDMAPAFLYYRCSPCGLTCPTFRLCPWCFHIMESVYE